MTVDPRQLFQAALLAQKAGDVSKTCDLCERIISSNPGFTPARLLLAIAMASAGETEVAIEMFKSLTQSDPTCQPAYNWLANLYRNHGNLQEALAMAEQSVRVAPDSADSSAILGACLYELKRYEEAASVLRRTAKMAPQMPAVQSTLASALEALGQTNQALVFARTAASLTPVVDEYLRLARLETLAGNLDRATECQRKVVEMEPSVASHRVSYAKALRAGGDFAEAQSQLQQASELDPLSDSVPTEQAVLLQSQGRFTEARRMFEKALELTPNLGLAYFGIVSAAKIKVSDRPLLHRMEQILAVPELSHGDEIHLLYGLGKANDDLADYSAAMRFYDAANDLAKKYWLAEPFDQARFASEVDQRIERFSSQLFEQLRPHGSNSVRPIFVVGMMRSGTTLVEQMLTRHLQITGVGEQVFWAGKDAEVVSAKGQTVSGYFLEKVGRQFLDLLDRLAPGAKHVIDKNPANIFAVGLIHAAFPSAKIVHVKRNPIDTALSIYMTPVATPPPFTCDKANIVFAYREYLRMAEHWRKVVSAEQFFEVEYEHLVGDSRSAMEGLLEFLGLEWNESCVHPEGNEKNVNTPSFWQVRQPLFSSSVERWKRYETWLGAFRDLADLK